MPAGLELLVLAIASMFWPTLILIVVVALRLSHPVKILAGFLAGGLLTTIAVGIAVVFALEGSDVVSGSSPSIDPAVDITIGLLSLLAAYVLNRRRGQPNAENPSEAEGAAQPKKPSIAERAVNGGAGAAFVAGVVLNIVPGTFPIVALKDISELDVSDAAKIGAIVIFYVIMFAFIEVPLAAYHFAPERTTVAVNDFNAWLGRNGLRLGVFMLAAVGLYLTARGVLELIG
jgi:hypothetical protein